MVKIKNIVKRLVRKFPRAFIAGRPEQVLIEVTNHCNLNCPFCLVGMQNDLLAEHGNVAHDLMSRKMGIMSPETFAVVRRKLTAFGIKRAFMHFQGEPFLNKHVSEFANQLKADGLYVGIFTNGQVFTNKIIAEITEAEIDLIRFSVDGASEETYQQNRVGGLFAKAYQNMKLMAEAHQGKNTRIEWQFLPLKNNEHEVEKARAMADEIGVHFFTKGFRETDSDLAPKDPRYRSSFLKKPCTDPYRQIGIYWNGDVVPCCYDVDGKEVMGNLLNENLESIWNSSRYVEFRKMVDEVKRSPEKEPEICKTCLRWK